MHLKSLKETKNLSKKISKLIKNGDVILLYGQIGVGKTTFVRFLINNLQNKKKIKKCNVLSPTFNIVYDYNIKNIKILHYDLYRIKNHNEIHELGIFENLSNTITIVEWPELIKIKPKNRIEIWFKYTKSEKKRIAKLKSFGKLKKINFNEI